MAEQELKDFKKYKRFPIQLANQTIMLIHLFDDIGTGLEHSMENIDMQEESQAVRNFDRENNPANQFFKQLEGHYSDAFLEDMVIECIRLLDDSDIRRKRFSEKMKIEDPDEFISRAKKALEKAESVIEHRRTVIIEKHKSE